MSNNVDNNKVMVEISGGVDSAVTTYLLKKQGYNCIGAMMRLHDTESFKKDLDSAKNMCKSLDIPFKLFDLRKEFKEMVIQYFVDSYAKAKTPNPCVMCNQKMKFGKMLEIAHEMGCKKIATGHYARIVYKNDCYNLLKAKDTKKDQSYVLFFLKQNQLSNIILPLGEYTKEQVKQIATKLNLDCAQNKESQDICFIEDGNYARFIHENSSIKDIPGKVVDCNGNILGEHIGLLHYTVGQRKGLGLAFNEPKYISKLDSKNNQIVLGNKEECIQNDVHIDEFTWTNIKYYKQVFNCEAKLRYRQKQMACTAYVNNNNKIRLNFENGVSAVAPGQFAVLYNGDNIIGGGTIIA